MASGEVLVIVGPTGAGKTELGVRLAKGMRPHGVIVSADSRQVYRGLDVATGKEGRPAELELSGVGTLATRILAGVHQVGVDLVGIGDRMSVARWTAWARPVIDALLDDGRTPIVVGGTGLYVQALVRGFCLPDQDPEMRAAVVDQLPENVAHERRLARKVAIEAHGGRPAPEPPAWRAVIIGIDPPARLHRERIGERIRHWFESGLLVDEVEGLLDEGYATDSEALTGLGYAEAWAMMEGRLSRREAIRATGQETWAYARRQRTFFRNALPEARWVGSVGEGVQVAGDLSSMVPASAQGGRG